MISSPPSDIGSSHVTSRLSSLTATTRFSGESGKTAGVNKYGALDCP